MVSSTLFILVPPSVPPFLFPSLHPFLHSSIPPSFTPLLLSSLPSSLNHSYSLLPLSHSSLPSLQLVPSTSPPPLSLLPFSHQIGLPQRMLQRCGSVLSDEAHPIHQAMDKTFERVSYQALTPADLRQVSALPHADFSLLCLLTWNWNVHGTRMLFLNVISRYIEHGLIPTH